MRLILLILFAGFSNLAAGQESEALSPYHSMPLHDDLVESSGLIYWDGCLWTHNDSRNTTLFRIDPDNGKILARIILHAVVNTDWEAMAQDRDYIYIGDIGNNSGSRRDLHILRISKMSLSEEMPAIDTIAFIYEDQNDFTSRPHATNFDCEAMVVQSGQIFLFTKEWISAGTSVYTLPARPGHHKASRLTSYPVEGLITGADISSDENTLILSGYNSLIQPFIYLLNDISDKKFDSGNFFGGTHQKIPLALPSHQVEGIAIKNAEEIYLTNEYLKLGSWIEVQQQLHVLNLKKYLTFDK